ncbi:MAG: PhoH family protein [Planctomycetota bacterium]|nr:PhoH family protein [Planctomycetota bacterium]
MRAQHLGGNGAANGLQGKAYAPNGQHAAPTALPGTHSSMDDDRMDKPASRKRSADKRKGGASVEVPAEVKQFVLDTNVLLHDPDALFVFKEHHVVIPFAVIEELDKMKRKEDDLGRNARETIRHLDRLREMGDLTTGVNWGEALRDAVPTPRALPLTRTGTIRIDNGEGDRPEPLSEDSPDNRIIAVAWRLFKRGVNTTFVTKDLAARIKSDALGVNAEDFKNQKVDADRLFSGYLNVTVPGELINQLYHDRLLPVDALREHLVSTTAEGQEYTRELIANQYVVFRDQGDENHTGLGRRLTDTDHIVPVTNSRKPIFGLMARNVQQNMALDALMDDEIRLVTLLGSAGTGKTLLALAAGMSKVFNDGRYDKLLVARPIMPLGRDIGYLPGDKDDKLSAWMQPIFDNLSYLLTTRGVQVPAAESHSTEQRIRKLMADGKLVLEPLTYIRGRSIPHQFIIVDEAQNLTPHEVKTIASRVGESTKLVLTGDIGQIDNPYLDSASNGLSYTVERMKGIRLFAHVTLAKSERSELASLAATRL